MRKILILVSFGHKYLNSVGIHKPDIGIPETFEYQKHLITGPIEFRKSNGPTILKGLLQFDNRSGSPMAIQIPDWQLNGKTVGTNWQLSMYSLVAEVCIQIIQ
jgi:hypothetical protein